MEPCRDAASAIHPYIHPCTTHPSIRWPISIHHIPSPLVPAAHHSFRACVGSHEPLSFSCSPRTAVDLLWLDLSRKYLPILEPSPRDQRVKTVFFSFTFSTAAGPPPAFSTFVCRLCCVSICFSSAPKIFLSQTLHSWVIWHDLESQLTKNPSFV